MNRVSAWGSKCDPDEIREVWGGQIEPVDGGLVGPGVSSGTRRFLTEVGLPTVEAYSIGFVRGERLSRRLRHDDREYLVIAEERDPNFVFAVDVFSDNVVHLYRPSSKYTQFCNSDIAAFTFFLGLLNRDVLGLDGEIIEDGIITVRTALRERDPAALETGTQWDALLDDLIT
ncbi:SUKH-4 family immunity protein [Nocardia sp. NPDC052566]|uniref:SUKH-4 family immunity protein n=1 Tax=Nocardia sp. NPDC052566 TaxID=3364330 RepID=UPI0037C5FA18